MKSCLMLLAISLAAGLIPTGNLPAQEVSATRAGLSSKAVRPSDQGSHANAVRVGTTALGVLGGMVAGGFLGYNLLPHTCECDDPGLDQLIYGALTGSALGAALGAAYPELGSACSFQQRFKRTLLGATAGAALGFILGGGGDSEAVVILTPAAAFGGSLAALGKCRQVASRDRDTS